MTPIRRRESKDAKLESGRGFDKLAERNGG